MALRAILQKFCAIEISIEMPRLYVCHFNKYIKKSAVPWRTFQMQPLTRKCDINNVLYFIANIKHITLYMRGAKTKMGSH